MVFLSKYPWESESVSHLHFQPSISRYKTVEVRTHYHTFPPHIASPDTSVLQSSVCRKEHGKLLDEVGGKSKHGQVATLVARLDERCHMTSCPNPCQISFLDTVYTHSLLESGVILVERSEQYLILVAYALIGIAHHFSRYVCLSVGYALIVLDDLRLDVIQSQIDVPCFGTLAFGSVAFRIPKGFRDGLLATELRLILSRLASFLPFFKVIPEIFIIFVGNYLREATWQRI